MKDIPKLWNGEIGFTTDTEQTFIGTNNKNIRLLDEKDRIELERLLKEINPKLIHTGESPPTDETFLYWFDTVELNLKRKVNTQWVSISPTQQEYTDYKTANNQRIVKLEEFADSMASGDSRKKFVDFAEPLYICHRGAAFVFPENTLEAYKGCMAMNNPLLELDARTLNDGGLALMHDATLETAAGLNTAVADYNTPGWKNLNVSYINGYKATQATMMSDVVSQFQNNAIYIVESKDQKSTQAIVDLLDRYGLREYALIQSFGLDDLTPAIAAGYNTLYLTSSAPVSTIKDRGIKYVGVSTSATDNYIKGLVDAGLKVIMYTVNNRYLRDKYLQMGVSGFFSDDPFYLEGKLKTLKRDPFVSQSFHWGMVPSYFTYRGGFRSPNRWGFTATGGDRNFILQGWAGKLPNSFVIDVDMTFDKLENGGWGSIAVCTPIDYFDDNFTNKSAGYHCLYNEAGALSLHKVTDGVATKIDGVDGTAVVQGATHKLRITVTATSITFANWTTGQTMTIADTTYRGGYLHFGRKWTQVSFSNVVIS